MPVLTLVGVLLSMGGSALFMVVVFSSGGLAKSEQFRVLGELVAGRPGPVKRGLLFVAMPTVMGMSTPFAGVAASDSARRQRCEERCAREGYESGRIGPPDAKVEQRPTRAKFVACRCEASGRPPLELPADDLVSR